MHYDIIVGEKILSQIGRMSAGIGGGRRAFLIADRRLLSLSRTVKTSLKKSGWTVESSFLTASEQTKDFRKLFAQYSKLIETGMDRHSVLFALGGGVVGDLAGF